MSMRYAFDTLRGAFEPLYEGKPEKSWCRYIGTISNSVTMNNQNDLVYHGRHFKRSVCTWDIREDGPDAWGCGFNLEAGTYFRYPGVESGWYQTMEHHHYTQSSGETSLETVTIHDDNTVSWVLHIFESI